MSYYQMYDSPVGKLLLQSDGESLTGLDFSDGRYAPAVDELQAEEKEIPVLEQTKQWLDIYFAGRNPDFCPPVNPQGTEFRREVWKLLLEIPYGETVTYGSLAKKMAQKLGKKRMSAQAIGGAVGHNPIGIIIPCHRVVGNNGNLTGYGGGMDRKVFLLNCEHMDMNAFSIPTN